MVGQNGVIGHLAQSLVVMERNHVIGRAKIPDLNMEEQNAMGKELSLKIVRWWSVQVSSLDSISYSSVIGRVPNLCERHHYNRIRYMYMSVDFKNGLGICT